MNVNDIALFSQALQQVGSQNKRLAAVGHAAVSLNLWASLWYPTSLSRGSGDIRRQQWLSNANLARRGRLLGVDAQVRSNPGTTAVTDSMVATAMEALIGAAYVDGGIAGVRTIMDIMDLGNGLD